MTFTAIALPTANKDPEKRREERAAYRAAHSVKIAAYQVAYNAAHHEERAAYYVAHREERAAYRAAHSVKIAAYRTAYRAAHREESVAYSTVYNAAHREESAAKHAAYYVAHREESAAKNRKGRYARLAKLQWLEDRKVSRGCEWPTEDGVCGYSDPRALDWNHLDPTTKSFALSQVSNHSREQIEAELSKCQVLCANHHRIHTKQEGHTRNRKNIMGGTH